MTFTAPEKPEIKLYHTDYVVLLRKNGQFLTSSRGEIVIFNDMDEAGKASSTCDGFVTCCTALFQDRQDKIIANIKHFRR